MVEPHYIIRGGIQGRERLRVLSRVMHPSTHALLLRAGLRSGMNCFEVGCGSGDVAFDMAQIVGADGRIIATDIDETKLELARRDSEERQVQNLEFRFADITQSAPEQKFDFVHARFVLTHLRNPEQALLNMRQAMQPGAIIVVEDIDFRGYFCEPDNASFRRYTDLYTQTVQRRGGDANIGPRLPLLLIAAGFENVQMNVVQHAGMTGDVKLITPLTMENIADAVLAEGLAIRTELDQITDELYEYARNPGTISSTPRIVEAWGHCPQV